MKILKTAEQRNFEVDKESYTVNELWDLIRKETIFSFNGDFTHKIYDSICDVSMRDTYRIYADDCKEVKVIYNKEYGAYENIVVTKSGMKIHITL